ncbi:L-aspartate oxidase [Arcobacter sp. FWKO B]|uniref:L-aspartate oxidase n=1 Tax=Arcobacter sp. FWKO B TaxID=2593672 RepID=UPI0018A33F62|nr:L-aspartate oxidase [Arcobacter sp. FWKO B]QOG11390.1 L-aspartate oxidase [Arcobacter sp. FWKO B]
MIYDYIIIGTGVAGLSAASYIPENKKVLLVCKKVPWECNTFWAQGGVATAVNENDIPMHIKDTIEAGAMLNDIEAVTKLSKISLETIHDLIEKGFEFDKNEAGELAFTKEAAHSRSRILHADGDATGRMLHIFLLGTCPHEVVTDSVVIDLLVQDDLCYGAVIRSGEKQRVVYAHNTIIASGGIGSIYKYHTNSTTVSGDIQGICSEKGLALKDMEMMQFHPTVFTYTDFARKPLLSEALRGEGAEIEDEDGRRFLFDYHCDGELAPRDVVSRAIFDYALKTGSQVYLSFKNFKKDFFKKRFPNIYKNLKELGFELPFERVPISPAFHYAMGGIETTLDAKVKGMKNLYAIGEAACSGVHGANRLASNSLLEGLVFSKIAVMDSLNNDIKIDPTQYNSLIKHYILQKPADKAIKNELRELMWTHAAIVRTHSGLEYALTKVNEYLTQDIGRLLYLRLLTAKAILEAALNRKESLGAHYIKD